MVFLFVWGNEQGRRKEDVLELVTAFISGVLRTIFIVHHTMFLFFLTLINDYLIKLSLNLLLSLDSLPLRLLLTWLKVIVWWLCFIMS